MLISALMTHEVEIIDPEATLQETAQRMLACHIRALPVGERDILVGILTDRDLVTRAITAGRDPTTTRVREVMTPDLVTCFADQEITVAIQLMHERQIHQLVVLSRDHHLVCIIALRDVPTPITVESLIGAGTRSGRTIRWPL
jgi:CBS domain-containing protein